MRKKSRFVVRLVLVVLLAFVCTVADAIVLLQPHQTLKVGALLPLNGRMAKVGQTASTTLEIAKNDFQKNYGIAIELIVEDTEGDPDLALSKLIELDRQGVRVVVGPFASESAKTVLPYANENQILLISPTSSAPSLALDDMLFRVTADDSKQAEALVHYVQDRQYGSILPVYRNDNYGNELYEQFKTQFEGIGGVVLDPIVYDVDTEDFQATVDQIRSGLESVTQNAAVFVIAYDEIVDIFNAASGDAVLESVPWIGADAASKNDAITQDSTAAAFAVQTQFTASISTTGAMSHPYLPFLNYLENLISKVRQENDSILEPYVGAIYDSLWLAGIALSDSTETDLKAVLIEKSQDLLGFSGAMDFDVTGDRPYCFYGLYRVISVNNVPTWDIIASYRISKYGSISPYQYREFVHDGSDKILPIGLLLPLTGEASSLGISFEQVLQKAKVDIDSVLQRYYTPNSYIEFIVADTQADPEVALEKLKEMHVEGVELFIGPVTSSELNAVSSYVNQNEILLISPSSTAMSLANDDNIFRLTLDDDRQAKALAALIQHEGFDAVEVLYRSGEYGSGFYERFKQHFTDLGKQCGEGTAYDPTTTDFGGVLDQFTAQAASSIEAFGAQKTAVLMVSYDEGVDVLETLFASNTILSNFRWFAADGMANNPLLIERPAAAAIAAHVGFTASILGTHTGEDTLFYTQSFLNDLEDYLQKEPAGFDVAAYDASWVFAQYPIYVDWDHDIAFGDLRDAFLDITGKSVGYLNVNFLNEEGDRLYGNFDFYSMKSDVAAPYWERTATYSFFIGPEILTYLNEGADSQAVDWELFK